MVVRVSMGLELSDLAMATGTSLAPTVQGLLPHPWGGPCVLASPFRWEGGTWHPGLRHIPLKLINAGPAPASLLSVVVEGDWLAVPAMEPLHLPGYGQPVPVTVPLRPAGLEPGLLTGAVTLVGQGWGVRVPVTLYMPFGSFPWWEQERVTLATHVQEHALSLRADDAPDGDAWGELYMGDQRIATPRPERDGDGWRWDLTLTAGEYRCSLLVDGKAVPLTAAAPHHWDWQRAGVGRLTVGAAASTATVRNVGDQAVECHVESDLLWLDTAPGLLRLEPGEAARLDLRDRLTALEHGRSEGTVRLLALPDRTVWATLPVYRQISAERPLPVLSRSSLQLSGVGDRVEEGRFTVRNAGGQPLRVRAHVPPGVTLRGLGDVLTLAPGEDRLLAVQPTDGEETRVLIRLETNAGYPSLQELYVTVQIRRLFIEADPPAVDFGPVAPGGSQYKRVKLRRGDGTAGRFAIEVPPEQAGWLEVRGDYLTARHRSRDGGPVTGHVVVRELFSGAQARLSVRALMQRPRMRHSGAVRLEGVRPGKPVRHVIRIWDEGQGLQVRDVRSTQHWLTARKTADGVELLLKLGKERRDLMGKVLVQTNDPDQPSVTIPVYVEVRPLRVWPFAAAAALLLTLGVLAGFLLLRKPAPAPIPPVGGTSHDVDTR